MQETKSRAEDLWGEKRTFLLLLLQSHEIATEEIHGFLQGTLFSAIIFVREVRKLAGSSVALGLPAEAHSTSLSSRHSQLKKSLCKLLRSVSQDGLVNNTESMLPVIAPLQVRAERF